MTLANPQLVVPRACRLEDAIMAMVGRLSSAERQFAWACADGNAEKREHFERAARRRDRAVSRLVSALTAEVAR